MSLVARVRRKARADLTRLRRTGDDRRRDRAMRALYRRFLSHGDLCFDVGANVGNRTAVFLELGARVIAVEPQRGCAEQLRERYGSRADLTIVEAALGPEPGEAELLQTRYDTIATLSSAWVESVQSSGRFPFEWNEKTTVPVTTLDALIDEWGLPGFCKIDVEGYEADVLAGLTHPIRTVSFEVTPEFIDAGLACVSLLEGLGLTEFAFSEGESLRLGQWRDARAIQGYLRGLPGDGRLFGDVYARITPSSTR